MATTWGVELTPCYPRAWYGGPYQNGIKMGRGICFYHYTEAEAWRYVRSMREHLQKFTKS